MAPLGAKAPTLRENGKAVAALTAVNLGRTKSIVLALDRSQSMRGQPLANAIAAAQSFTGAVGAEDHVGVVAFGHNAVALTRGSSSPAEARDQLCGHDRRQQAGTALYDAIVAAADNLGQDDRPGRAIVVVTDGARRLEPAYVQRCRRAAHKANAAIYAIGIAGPASTPATLRKLAAETGGSYRQASTSAKLAATYAGLRDELARTWQLSYLTSSPPGSKVDVDGGGRRGSPALRRDLAFSRSNRDNPTGLIPSAGYSAVGTLIMGAVVGASSCSRAASGSPHAGSRASARASSRTSQTTQSRRARGARKAARQREHASSTRSRMRLQTSSSSSSSRNCSSAPTSHSGPASC